MASKFMVIRQERHDLKNEALHILDISPVTRTATQTARLAAIETAIPKLDVEIARMAELMEIDRHAPRPGAALVQPGRGLSYAQLFGTHAATDTGDFGAFSDFVDAVHSRQADPRLRATATVGVPSEGGFGVPDQFTAMLMDAAAGTEIIRPRCTVIPMTSKTLAAPIWESSTDATTGGWTAEAVAITESTPKLRAINLSVKKLAVLAEVSAELQADGLSYGAQLERRFSRAIARHLDRAFIRGAGAHQPLGILSGGALVVTPKVLGQTAGTVAYQNLCDMYAALPSGSMRAATWIISPTLVPGLLMLTNLMGTSGESVKVLNESSGRFTIFGLDVVFSDLLPTKGAQGDVLLCDLSAYIVGLRSGIELARSEHAGFQKATTYYRALLRADGQPGIAAPVTREDGSTESPFVTLAERV